MILQKCRFGTYLSFEVHSSVCFLLTEQTISVIKFKKKSVNNISATYTAVYDVVIGERDLKSLHFWM